MIRPRALVFALFAFVGASASAQDQTPRKPGVTITFRGLGTGPPTVLARPRHFAPITVVLTNDGEADVDGLLRVYRSQEVAAGVAFSAVPEQGLFYERPVKVPRGGKRVEELYYYCQDREPDRVCVAFETSTGDTIVAAPHPKLDLRTNEVLALSVTSSDQDDAVSLGAGVVCGPRRGYELQVKHGDPVSLPERPEGYGAFDLVILADLDPRSISKQQARALSDWVELGGDLLIASSGKQGESLSALDDALVPALPAAGEPFVSQDLHALEPLVPGAAPMERPRTAVRRVAAKPGARILAGSDDLPLIVRGRVGAGRVTYLAFPLAALKSSWGTDKSSGGKSILALMAHPPAEDLDAFQPPPLAPPLEEVLLNLTEALKTLEPPSALLVAPLLILYVTLVAPLNYIVLTRMGKRDLATATAALIAVVFGALFYGIGWYVHGSGALVARAAIVELPATPEGRARVDTMTGFFSTDRGVLDATASKGSAIGPVAERPTGRGGRVVQPVGADPFLKAVELDTWSLRRFKATRLEAVGGVVADLRFDGSFVVGTVENKTKWTLETPVVLVGDRFVDLPDIRPGDKVELHHVPGQKTPGYPLDSRIIRGMAQGAFKARYGEASGFGPGASDPFQGDSSARFRGALDRRLRAVNVGPEAVPALFAACVERDMGGVDMGTKASLELARALVLSEVSIGAKGPELSFRELEPSVYHAKNYEPFSGATGSAARLAYNVGTDEPGTVTYEWRLPASKDLPFHARNFEVAWNFLTDPEKEKVILRFYDWTAGSYKSMHRVEFARRSFQFSRAASIEQYVNPESGFVRIQIESQMGELYVNDVTLSVAGTRSPAAK